MSAVLPDSGSGVSADESLTSWRYTRTAQGPTETFTHEAVGPGGQHLISPEGCEAFSERNESTRPHLAPTTGPHSTPLRPRDALFDHSQRYETTVPDTVTSCLHREEPRPTETLTDSRSTVWTGQKQRRCLQIRKLGVSRWRSVKVVEQQAAQHALKGWAVEEVP